MADETEQKTVAQQVRALTSAILSRQSLAEKAGKAFGGRRDYFDTLGYQKRIFFDDYLHRYRRDHIAQRIIDAPALGVWRRVPQLKARDDNGEFSETWRQLDDRVRTIHKLEKVDRLSGIGEFGILLIGVRDGRAMKDPVGPVDGPEDILYLSALPQNAAKIQEVDRNPKSARFGLPTEYRVEFSVGTEGGGNLPRTVHHSRVIHVAEGTVDDPIRGRPRLEAVFNLLDDLRKVVGGSAEFFWRIADRGMQVDVDPEMEIASDDLNKLDEELEEYVHDIRRFIRTRGVTMKNLGSETSNPNPSYSAIIDLISGATGIPRRVLTGTESGQLASQQDRSNWIERLDERSRFFAEPDILRPFANKLIRIGALPEPSGGLQVDWPPLLSLTDSEQVQNAMRIATAAKGFAQARQIEQQNGIGQAITADDLRRVAGLGEKNDDE